MRHLFSGKKYLMITVVFYTVLFIVLIVAYQTPNDGLILTLTTLNAAVPIIFCSMLVLVVSGIILLLKKPDKRYAVIGLLINLIPTLYVVALWWFAVNYTRLM